MAPTTPPSVRLAMPSEAEAIARLQRAAWTVDHRDVIARAFCDAIDEEAAAEAWRRAIVAPPLATMRVLVALDDGVVVGYAATGPSDDPDATEHDATIADLVIDPALRRQGHGSRLMHAVADTLVADRFQRARTWVPTDADGTRAFLVEQGFGPDGAHQELSTDSGATLKLVRLHTLLQG